MAWQEYAPNVPRFQGVSQRLLIEGERTNQNTNPRAEGLSAGTPGTRPTNWPALPTGVSTQIVGAATVNGVQGVLVRFFGVPSVTSGQLWPVGGAADVVIAGTTVSNSVFVALYAGSLTNVAQMDLRCASEGGATNFTPSAAMQRVSNIRVTTGVSSNTTLRWNYVDTVTAVDFTLFVGWPTREHAPFPSSPILPAVGTPATSVRSADLQNWTLASLGVAPNGACTILGAAMLPQAAPAGVSQAIVEVDDGSADNRFFIRNDAGGNAVNINRVLGGVAGTTTLAGTMTPGTLFRFGLTIDGAGRIAASFNGGAVVAVTGGPTTGLTTLRAGNNSSGSGPMFGELGSLRVLQGVVSDADLPALVNTL